MASVSRRRKRVKRRGQQAKGKKTAPSRARGGAVKKPTKKKKARTREREIRRRKKSRSRERPKSPRQKSRTRRSAKYPKPHKPKRASEPKRPRRPKRAPEPKPKPHKPKRAPEPKQPKPRKRFPRGRGGEAFEFFDKISRANAARKGWITRRAHELEKNHPYLSERAKELWSRMDRTTERSITALREASGIIDMRRIENKPSPANIQMLRAHIEANSAAWQSFLYSMQRLGMTPSEARSAWFSPKVRKR